ncbi:MAG TPA: hypothetical protein VGR45_03825 [Stellaceae bacterium]|nr:hypothetical protein [Stellaceae bacterium]
MAEHRETKLEMARRHVHEGEEHIARQREIIAGLQDDGEVKRLAQQLLLGFETIMREHRASLARLEKSAVA